MIVAAFHLNVPVPGPKLQYVQAGSFTWLTGNGGIVNVVSYTYDFPDTVCQKTYAAIPISKS